MKFRITFVFNNCDWVNLEDRVKSICQWFKDGSKGKIEFDFNISHTQFLNIPFVPVQAAELKGDLINMNYNQGWYAISDSWYDQNIVSIAPNSDFIIFLMNFTQWNKDSKSTLPSGMNGARGWRTDHDQGPIEIQIGSDEKMSIGAGADPKNNLPGFNEMLFEHDAKHEISHGFFMLTGQEDLTHYNDYMKRDLSLMFSELDYSKLQPRSVIKQYVEPAVQPHLLTYDELIAYCKSVGLIKPTIKKKGK